MLLCDQHLQRDQSEENDVELTQNNKREQSDNTAATMSTQNREKTERPERG